jgi:hypothetical protein
LVINLQACLKCSLKQGKVGGHTVEHLITQDLLGRKGLTRAGKVTPHLVEPAAQFALDNDIVIDHRHDSIKQYGRAGLS